jgi:hypothetical protein
MLRRVMSIARNNGKQAICNTAMQRVRGHRRLYEVHDDHLYPTVSIKKPGCLFRRTDLGLARDRH